MYVPGRNMTDGPVVIDEDGRTLGGSEWGVIDRFDPVAVDAVGSSRVRIFPDLDDAGQLNDDARAALEDAADAEARRARVAGLSDERVGELLGLDADNDLDSASQVAQARRALVLSDTDLDPPVADAEPGADADPDSGDGTPKVPAKKAAAGPKGEK